MANQGSKRELRLTAGAMPHVRRMTSGVLSSAVALASDDPASWPRRHGNASGLGPESIVYAHARHASKACDELVDVEPDSDDRLPTSVAEHAELAGLARNANDHHAVVFDPQGRAVTPAVLGMLVDQRDLGRPRSFSLRFRATKCSPRKQRPGVWRSSGSRGAVFIEAALIAEGRRAGDRLGGPATDFDRYAVQILSLPVDQLTGESEQEMIVRILGQMLDSLDEAAALLVKEGLANAAAVLTTTPLTGDVVRFGAPQRRGVQHATSREVWLGTMHGVWDLLRKRRRPAALALARTLDATTPAGAASPGCANLSFGHGSGRDLARMLDELLEAVEPRDVERMLRKLDAVPYSDADLAAANIDAQDVDWLRIDRDVMLRSTMPGVPPTQHRLLVRRGEVGAVNVYAVNTTPNAAMLKATDSSYMHGIDPYTVCLSRQERRFGSPIELSGSCGEGLWTGLTAALLDANLVFVAAALQPLDRAAV
jgi:hypothetical protein